MFFTFLSIIVPLVIYLLLPVVAQIVIGKPLKRDALLLIACLCYFISWYLPSPLIHGQDTSFTTHVIGGGVFSGFLWLYLKRQLNWKLLWIEEMMSLYAFVCAFGVANELFELLISELHLVRINGADTWWDLLANTLGAFVFWIGYRIVQKIRR